MRTSSSLIEFVRPTKGRIILFFGMILLTAFYARFTKLSCPLDAPCPKGPLPTEGFYFLTLPLFIAFSLSSLLNTQVGALVVLLGVALTFVWLYCLSVLISKLFFKLVKRLS